MKCITLLLDGASDRSYESLDFKTPLQYANLSHLDSIARDSQCGIMTVLEEGRVLGTDLAHFLLFSNSISDYPGRAIIDALGEDLLIDDQTLYLRASLASVVYNEGYELLHRFTPDLLDEEIKTLIADLKTTIDGYDFSFHHSYDSHGFVLVRGPVDDRVSDSDPFMRGSYVMAVEAYETTDSQAKRTADAINQYIKYTYDILSKHVINEKRLRENQSLSNIILTKWAGMNRVLPSFEEKNGMKGVIIGQSNLLKGMAKLLKMDYYHYDDFNEAVNYALSCPYDYVHLHTKTPDTASHKKDPHLKVKALETIDEMIQPLMDFNGLLIVTSDHSTPSSGLMIHSGESVAFMAKGEYIRRDDVLSFDEISCSKGSLYLMGKDFMPYIIGAVDQGVMYHLRQGNHRKNHQIKNVNKLL